MNTALSVAAPGVLGNDSDPNNKPLTAILVAGPSHGTLTLNSNGSFTYTPATGFFGTDSFTYQASDGPLQSNVATVTLTVGAPPVAANDSYTTAENTALAITAPGVLGNDTDPNNAPLTAVLAAGPAHGTLTLKSDGSFTYTPAANYYGTDSFTYKASDGPFQSNVATVALTVLQPPTANNDAYSTAINTALSVAAPGVLANDSDPNKLPLTAVLVAGPAHGTLALNGDGSFTYTPAASFFGYDSFTYKASDGQATSNVATVTLTVGQPPTAGNDAYATAMNAALSIAAPGALANDSDPQGSPLTAVLVAGPSHGTLTLNANGSFTYTPTTGFFGTDSFTYKASDGPLVSSPATVTLTVYDYPTAQNDSYAYIPGSPLTTTVAQTFVTMSSQPGDWVGQGQNYSFTPANSTITAHLLTDGPIVSGVEVDVTATGQSWTLDFTAPSPGWLVPGTYTGATRWPFEAAGVPGLDVSGDGRGSNTIAGQFTVTQAVYGASGNLVTFGASFTQYGDGSTAALTGQVDFHFTNGLPNGVLANDSDANPAATLTAVPVAGPSHGTVRLNADGSFAYTPAAGFAGTDSFTYMANNGQFNSNVATVTLTADQPPTAQNDAYTLGANSSLIAGVGGTFMTMNSQPGDYIGQGQPYYYTPANSTITATASGNTVQVQVTQSGESWTLDFAAPNSGRLVPGVYTGATEFWSRTAGTPGLDVSGYGRGASGIAGAFTVSQAVYDTSGNLVSFAARFVQYNSGSTVALTGQVAFNSTRTPPGGVLANDSGTTLTAALVSNPAHGTLVINPDGSFAYFPAAGFTGTDSFTYRASDGSFSSGVATVTLTVAAPAANNDTGSTTENTALSVAAPGVLANDSDPNNDPLAAVLAAGPAHGTVALNADGSYTYTPAANFVGTDSFTYQAGDGLATSGTATVTITVAPPSQVTYSIWGPGATPQTADANDGGAVELGVRFTPSVSGTITALRFYKGPLNTGAHVADLWSSTGALLATATFTGETASGWQQVNFATPVAVTAGTTYVASYHTDVGEYAVDRNYFAAAYSSGPLQVPANGGVYAYGAAGTFPSNSYQGSNYWVDVVLAPGGTGTAPAVTGESPASGATGVAVNAALTATFNEAVQPGTIAFTLTGPGNTAVPAALSYNSSTDTATLTPLSGLAAGTTYTATVAGATDTSGDVMSGPFSWTFTTSATYGPGPFSIWSPPATPQAADANDGNAVELGVRFTPSISGTITALRFYKGSLNTGAHVADLWSSTGALLATATFTGETASGWQQVSFSTPVAVTAGATYVASYHTDVGEYAVDRNYFAAAYSSGPLQVPANGGVYGYGPAGTFPSASYQGSNYWVDVVLAPSTTGSVRTSTSGSTPTDPGGPAGAMAIASTTATPVRSAAAALAGIRGQVLGSRVAASGGALSSSSLAIGALDLGGDDPAGPAVPSVGERSSARGGLVRIRRRP
jgi:VCBS repeat-containing protein